VGSHGQQHLHVECTTRSERSLLLVLLNFDMTIENENQNDL